MDMELSSSQNQILETIKFVENNSIAGITVAILCSGEGSRQALLYTLDYLFRKIPILNTVINIDNGKAKQRISYHKKHIQVLSFQKKSDLDDYALKMAASEFDIETTLCELTGILIEGQAYGVLIHLHHLVGDATSILVIAKYFQEVYQGYLSGNTVNIPETSYFDDVIKEKHFRKSNRFLQDKAYWLSKYENGYKPTYVGGNVSQSLNSVRYTYIFEPAETDRMLSYCRNNNISLLTLFTAALGCYFCMVQDMDEINIATAVDTRLHEEDRTSIGMYVNTLVLRLKLNRNETWKATLDKTKKEVLQSFKHCRYNYTDLANDLMEKGCFSGVPYDVYISYLKRSVEDADFEWYHCGRQTESISLNLGVFHERIEILCDYQTEKFSEADISILLRHLNLFLDSAIENDMQLLKEIDVQDDHEKDLVRYGFNDTYKNYPTDHTVIDLFNKQAIATPDKIAVICEDQLITYHELNQKSNQLAQVLNRLGPGKDEFIAICADRSIEMVIAVLATLKAGFAYVPIALTNPNERKQFIIEDCNPKAIISYKAALPDHLGIPVIDLSDQTLWQTANTEFYKPVHADNLAYCIYTSGTTGVPKGVLIEHGGLTNLLYAYTDIYSLTDQDTVLQFANLSFDQSVWDIFNILTVGGTLCLMPLRYIGDPRALEKYMTDQKVTVASFTPAFIRELRPENLPYLRVLDSTGEAADADILIKWSEYVRVFNTYGPTEVSVNTSSFEVTHNFKSAFVPIGKPISNTNVFIIKDDRLCGIGMPGELCIAGAGMARGYLNKPELTAEKFTDNPYGAGKLYRTGDLAYWLPDGNIAYAGRIDEQVKIRGFRIELGEIEYVLREIRGITDAAVVARKDHSGDTAIYAYYVSEGKLTVSDIRTVLSRKLPYYMIPGYFMQVSALPLMDSGKVDKKHLPDIVVQRSCDYVPPETETQIQISRIYKDVLRLDEVGIHDNFFEIGGHSLRATKIINLIESQLGVRITIGEFFENPNIKKLAEIVDTKASREFAGIPNAEQQASYAMSSAQKSIYLTCQLDPGNTTYNMPGAIEIQGNVQYSRVEYVLNQLIARHETLRTSFELQNDDLVQIIHPDIKIKLERFHDTVTDLHTLIQSFVKPFDLSQAPLLRSAFMERENKTYILFDMHHIISDGMSINILLEEFIRLYNGEELEPLRVHYKDYSEWMWTRDLSSQRAYWLEEFGDEIPVLDLPLDYARPQIQSHRGSVVSAHIDRSLREKIDAVCRQTEATEFMVLLTALMVLLGKYSRQEDIVVGTPVSGRTHRDTERMLGMFVNTLAIRGRPEREKTAGKLIGEIREKCLRAYENQEYAFEELVDKANVTRDMSRNPVFDVMFVLQNNEAAKGRLEDVKEVRVIEENSGTSKFDLAMEVTGSGEGYALRLEYCTDLFKEETARLILAHYINLLEEMAASISEPIGSFSMMDEAEREKVLNKFNDTQTDYPKDQTIVQLFETQAESYPDNTAVIYQEEKLSYAQLNAQANRVAAKLRKLGVGKDDLVAIVAKRSLEMIVGLCGILKAGGAYLPVDPDYPEDRVRFMLEDSLPKAVLLANAVLPAETDLPVLDLCDKELFFAEEDGNPPHINSPSDLAYCIYTSGTTGKPKGTLVEHKNVLRTVCDIKYIALDNSMIIMQMASISFDISTFEIWSPLLNGGRLILADNDVILNPAKLKACIRAHKVNMLAIATALFNQMIQIDCEIFDGLEDLFFGGEQCSYEYVKILRDHNKEVNLFNVYGPTESTTAAALYRVPNRFDTVPIGVPMANTQLYIMNQGSLCGIGIPGELCIAGAGVARGYLNRPQLTSEKFVSNLFGAGKMYLSGDLARWLPDGNVEYMGRIDEQVKIRGFRVELGEIESNIRRLKGVADCAVIIRKNSSGENTLYAYLVGDKTHKIEIDEVRASLRLSLPEHMVPLFMMEIEALPITRNGKLDKRALPDIKGSNKTVFIAPRNKNEEIIASFFCEILGVDFVGVRDNFFELGGHSLRAMRVVNRVESRFGVRLPLQEVFQNPTVEGMVSEVEKQCNARNLYREIPVAETKAYYKMSSTQKRMYVMSELDGSGISYNMPAMLEISGEIDCEKINKAFHTLINRHEILRTRFDIIQDEPVQIISDTVDASVEFMDIEDFVKTHEGKPSIAKNDLFADFVCPFDLSKAPLVRIRVIKATEKKFLLLFDMHHIISDGMSINILLEEFIRLYNGEELEPLRVHYKDYSEWMWTRDLSSQRAYWLEEFGDEIPVLDLPLDYARPQIQSHRGSVVSAHIDRSLREKIDAVCRQTEATEFMVLLTALMVLLGKYSRQEDIVVGTPVSGRTHRDTERMLGMFVNTLAIRGRPEREKTAGKLIGEIREKCLRAYENQEYAFEELVDKANVTRDMSRNPVFDVMFVLQNNEAAKGRLEDVKEVRVIEENSGTSKFDLAMEVTGSGEGYALRLEYCTDLFKEETARLILAHYINLLEEMAASISEPIGSFSMMDEAEREKVLNKFNDTQTDYPKDQTIVQLFETQAESYPDNTAVIYQEEKLSYAQLNAQANRVAAKLRKLGVGKDDLVAIVAKRSLEMIVGLCGILKAGGAYLPVDPDYPEDRVRFMLEDSLPKAVLLANAVLPAETDLPVLDLCDKELFFAEEDGNPPHINSPSDLAYCIYTSGTTGKPKGTLVEQAGVTNLAVALGSRYAISSADVILQYATISFDSSVWEIFMALLNGAGLCVAPQGVRYDPQTFLQYIKRHGVSVMLLPPQFCMQLNHLPPIRLLLTAGSEATRSVLETVPAGTAYINEYGPTEGTVCATYWKRNPLELIPQKIPIGKPVCNKRIYILDQDTLCGIGIPGELCIAGVGIARGYLNRPERSAGSFVEDPFYGGRMYRSGDLARWLPDGNIGFMGRIDEQVKIRGFRVELGEIESTIRQCSGIRTCAVTVTENEHGEKSICAYFSADEKIDPSHLKRELKQSLPDYMIPAYFMQLDNIPVTNHGKLDKKALPPIAMQSQTAYIPPRNTEEKLLKRVFEEILGIEKISVRDDFFDLGGDSIKAIRAVSSLKENGYEVSVMDFMHLHTVEAIASELKDRQINASEDALAITEQQINYGTALNQAERAGAEEYKQLCAYGATYVSTVEESYPTTMIQQIFYTSQPENICVLKVGISGKTGKDQLIAAVRKLISDQNVLRSFYDINEEKIKVRAYTERWEIPYFEAGDKPPEYFDKLCVSIGSDYTRFIGSNLLSKLWIVKVHETEHILYLAVHHCVWDLMSNGILLALLRGLLNHQQIKHRTPQKNRPIKAVPDHFYETYVSALESYKRVLSDYEISEYKVHKTRLEDSDYEKILNDPNAFVMQSFYENSLLDTDLTLIPFAILYHGRTASDYNTLGLYLDLLPALYNIENHTVLGGLDLIGASYQRYWMLNQYSSFYRYYEDRILPIVNTRLIFDHLDDMGSIDKGEISEFLLSKIALETGGCSISADFSNDTIRILLPKLRKKAGEPNSFVKEGDGNTPAVKKYDLVTK